MKHGRITGYSLSVAGLITLLLVIFHIIEAERASLQFIIIFGSLIFTFSGISLAQYTSSPYKRKKYLKFSLPLSIIIVVIALIFKYFHIAGASVLIIVGTMFLAFSVTPVLAKKRHERWRSYTSSKLIITVLMVADTLGLILIFLGLLFFVQHWNGYLAIIAAGGILLVVSLIAWNNIFEQLYKFQVEARIILEEKNKDILDSIKYAKRIQDTILPPPKIVDKYLENSFIYYRPKDIVAGDFYWMEVVDKKVFFAAADCTGHGVPGAMISVMCSNALTKVVKEMRLFSPSKILDETANILKDHFEKSDQEVNDGMDIALCCLDSEQKILSFSGARNPLYHIRNKEFIEHNADRQSIDRNVQKEFTNHLIPVQTGDCFYIFSDGYIDQFGGEKGKKFMSKSFRELIMNIHRKPMEEQKKLLDSTLEKWMGGLEQVDDILIIGLQITSI